MLNKFMIQELNRLSGLLDEGGNTRDLQREINNLKNTDTILFNKLLDILTHLELSNNSGLSDGGFWYDTLQDSSNIESIEGLKLDTNRNRIFGGLGNIQFKNIELQFKCDMVKYTHNLDNNFIEIICNDIIDAGCEQLTLNNYSYIIK